MRTTAAPPAALDFSMIERFLQRNETALNRSVRFSGGQWSRSDLAGEVCLAAFLLISKSWYFRRRRRARLRAAEQRALPCPPIDHGNPVRPWRTFKLPTRATVQLALPLAPRQPRLL